MGNIQKFGAYTQEVRQAAAAEARKTKTNTIRLKAGRTVLRLCPRPAPLPPIVISHVHWLEPTPKKWVSFACPRLMAGKRCPECEFEAKIAASGSQVDQDEVYRRQAQCTIYTNAILESKDEDAPVIVQEFQFTDGIREKIDAIAEDFGDPWDVASGYYMSFNIPEGKNQRDCTVGAVNKGRAVPLDPDGDWVQQLKGFQNRVKLYSVEDIVSMMEGRGRPGGRPTNQRVLPAGDAGRGRTVADDDADDDDDD